MSEYLVSFSGSAGEGRWTVALAADSPEGAIRASLPSFAAQALRGAFRLEVFEVGRGVAYDVTPEIDGPSRHLVWDVSRASGAQS